MLSADDAPPRNTSFRTELDSYGFVSSRASRTILRYFREASGISLLLPVLNAAAETSSPPTPSAADPARINSAAVSRLTPPVGTIGICGNGPFSALMYFAPPTDPQGNTFT